MQLEVITFKTLIMASPAVDSCWQLGTVMARVCTAVHKCSSLYDIERRAVPWSSPSEAGVSDTYLCRSTPYYKNSLETVNILETGHWIATLKKDYNQWCCLCWEQTTCTQTHQIKSCQTPRAQTHHSNNQGWSSSSSTLILVVTSLSMEVQKAREIAASRCRALLFLLRLPDFHQITTRSRSYPGKPIMSLIIA